MSAVTALRAAGITGAAAFILNGVTSTVWDGWDVIVLALTVTSLGIMVRYILGGAR